ncbi:FHA domain-containing protein [Endozoicomonadaceae bacterium StTr2]
MLTLTIISSPESAVLEARYCQLPMEGGVIGRSENCTLQLPDAGCRLSRQHARFVSDGSYWFVEDLSSNGLFINDDVRPLGRGNQRRLLDGDTLQLGGYRLLISTATQAGTSSASNKSSGILDSGEDSSGNGTRSQTTFQSPPVLTDVEAGEGSGTAIDESVDIPGELVQVPVLSDEVEAVRTSEKQMTAMIRALELLLDELDPDRVERRLKCEEPLWRRSGRLWRCYERYYGRMRREGEYIRLFRLWYQDACKAERHNGHSRSSVKSISKAR